MNLLSYLIDSKYIRMGHTQNTTWTFTIDGSTNIENKKTWSKHRISAATVTWKHRKKLTEHLPHTKTLKQ